MRYRPPLLPVLLTLAACSEHEPAPATTRPTTPPPATPVSGPASGLASQPAAVIPVVPPLPQTRVEPVTDTYFGVTVRDPYRWLEDWASPAVKAWSDAENAHARAILASLPAEKPLTARLEQLMGHSSPSWFGLVYRPGALFALELRPPANHPRIVVMPDALLLDKERVVLDPDVLDPSGGTEIDFYVPSLDGKKVAVSLSQHGSEAGDLHVYDAATGKELGDVIHGVNYGTAGGSVAWNADGSGLFYTRYPAPGERPAEDAHFYQQVYYHQLGTPTSKDVYAFGKDLPRIAEIALETSDDGHFVLAQVRNGDGGEVGFWLLPLVHAAAGRWEKVAGFEDGAKVGHVGRDGNLYLLSRAAAPKGKILVLPAAAPVLARARVVVPEGDASLDDFVPAGHALYVKVMNGGPSDLVRYDLAAAHPAAAPVTTLLVGDVGDLVALGGDAVLFENESYLVPPAFYAFAPGDKVPTRTPMAHEAVADYSGYEVVREWAVSKDGTRVPMSILRHKGLALDGQNPTLLYGYGGYGVSQEPHFSDARMAWLEQGGVYVEANIRGGTDFGEQWHAQGQLTHKQNVFDDFAACAAHLVDARYTNPKRLAIIGASNGGLLMGAMITQHPELFRAVVSAVGIYDMLRVELSPNGTFNVTEFGTVKNPEQFKALYAYSPYHRVVAGTRYPDVLMLTGANDPRVDPLNSRKMIAALQAADPSARILLRTTDKAGHGIGTALSERIAQQVDMDAFLMDELGMTYRPQQ